MLLTVAFVHPRTVAAATEDTDGDGYDNATEVANGYTPYGPGTLQAADSDDDGLSDGDELLFGSNPLQRDSDGDGYDDGSEVARGYDPTTPAAVKLKKRILITLSDQRLAYYLGPKRIAVEPVSTGRPGMPTPVGTFAILDKKPRAWSARARLWMPWWMPFVGSTYGIHELPEWPGGKKEGEAHLGTPVSGGCIRLGVGPAKALYDWVEIGTEVDIRRT